MELNLTNEQLKAYARGPEPVPEGVYQVQICDIAEKPTQSGGIRLHITEKITTGEYAGRYVWHDINIVCPISALAEDIAKQDISTLALTAGIEEMHDTNELLGKTVFVRITHRQYMDEIRMDARAVPTGDDGAP